MIDSLVFDACYAGFNDAGQAILRPEFARSLRETYRKNGWGVPRFGPVAITHERGYATDAAIVDEEPDWIDYEDMNQLYERLLQSGEQPPFAATLHDDDFEGRAESTRRNAEKVRQGCSPTSAAEEEKLFAAFKQARGWDAASDEIMRSNFELQRAYAELLQGVN